MFRRYRFLLFSMLVFTACKKVDINFGDQFLDNGYTQVVKVDSFGVDMATVYVDSFITSSSGVSLLGGYTDPLFGRIDVQNYFEVMPPAYVDSFINTTFDSLVLVLRPNKTYYGDSTQPLHIIVNQLAEPVVGYNDNQASIYNTRSFAVQPTPIGNTTVAIRPAITDTIKVRLSDNLGKAFLQKLQDPSDITMQHTEAFLQYFYGIRLSSTGSDQLVIGCNDSVSIRLYYKKPGLYLQQKTLDLSLANKNHHFNNIQADRSGTALKNLAAAQQLQAGTTNNAAYSQYASGAMVKIRFPTVRDVLKLPNYAKLLKATLTIKPVSGTYGSMYYLPPSLRLSQTTQLNQPGVDLTVRNNDGSRVTQLGNLAVDYLYGENTSYTYDVTDYIRGVIADASINNNGLLLIPPSQAMATQFARLVVGSSGNTQSRTQLSILYASVQ